MGIKQKVKLILIGTIALPLTVALSACTTPSSRVSINQWGAIDNNIQVANKK